MFETIIGGLFLGLFAAFVIFVNTILSVIAGAFTGWIVSLFFGSWVAAGAAAFGLKFVSSQLWAIGAFLGFVSGFFRSATTKKN